MQINATKVANLLELQSPRRKLAACKLACGSSLGLLASTSVYGGVSLFPDYVFTAFSPQMPIVLYVILFHN